MSRISGSANFTPVSTDSADETSEVSSAPEQVCSVEPQYSPVDTIQAHGGDAGAAVHGEFENGDQEEGTPAYLSLLTGGRAAHDSLEKNEAEQEGAELPASRSHPESEFVPSDHQRVWVNNEHTDGEWKEEEPKKGSAASPKPKWGEIELKGESFEKHSEAFWSQKANISSGDSSVSSDFNFLQATAQGSSKLSVNVKEGEVAMGVALSGGVDLMNARVGGQTQVGGVKIGAALDAKVGIEAHVAAKEELNWKKGKVELSLGAGATVARVGAKVSASKGGVEAVAQADAEYGLEANVTVHAGMENGKFKITIDEAVALGVGEHANVALEINPDEIRESAKKGFELAEDLSHAAKAAVTDAVRSEVDDHLRAFAELAESVERLRNNH